MVSIDSAGAERNYSFNGVRLYLWRHMGEGGRRLEFAQKPSMVEVNEGEDTEACALLSMDAAQMLIDELWNAGLRPKYAQATDETKAAQREHIADLRDVVTRLLALSERV